MKNDLGADAAAVVTAEPVASDQLSRVARVLAEFDRQFGTDGPEKNSDSDGRRAGCDDCGANVELRAEHRAFVERVITEANLNGQLNVWKSFADFIGSDPRNNWRKP